MTSTEKRAACSIAFIHALRMLGLFMILPIFSLYAIKLPGATPLLIGIATGIYGLTQAFLQIPLGTLSDFLGRKPVIITGLIIFILGSIIAAMSPNIYGVILGRALQGAGAIGSAITALLADLTRDEHRTKAMAIIGLTIGISFSGAMVLGPVMNTLINVPGIFWLSGSLGVLAILLLLIWVPTPKKQVFHRDAEPVLALILPTLKNKDLLRLDFGILVSHALIAANFVVLPVILQNNLGIAENKQWLIYLPILLLSFIAMLPMIIIAEKKRQMKRLLLIAINMLILSEFCLTFFHTSFMILTVSLFIFLTAFCFLEASLPSLISKQAPIGSKGTAMGVYSTAQFFGIFLGGAIGGWLYGHEYFSTVFLICTLLALFWLLIIIGMPQPLYLSTQILNIGSINADRARYLTKQLLAINGIHDALIVIEEGTAYLKVDQEKFDSNQLQQLFVEPHER